MPLYWTIDSKERVFTGVGPAETGDWVKPELVVEVTYLTWTEDNLLRQVS